MKRFMHLALLLVALAACAVGQEGYAQRRINPVKSASKGIEGKNENRNPNDSIDLQQLARCRLFRYCVRKWPCSRGRESVYLHL